MEKQILRLGGDAVIPFVSCLQALDVCIAKCPRRFHEQLVLGENIADITRNVLGRKARSRGLLLDCHACPREIDLSHPFVRPTILYPTPTRPTTPDYLISSFPAFVSSY